MMLRRGSLDATSTSSCSSGYLSDAGPSILPYRNDYSLPPQMIASPPPDAYILHWTSSLLSQRMYNSSFFCCKHFSIPTSVFRFESRYIYASALFMLYFKGTCIYLKANVVCINKNFNIESATSLPSESSSDISDSTFDNEYEALLLISKMDGRILNVIGKQIENEFGVCTLLKLLPKSPPTFLKNRELGTNCNC